MVKEGGMRAHTQQIILKMHMRLWLDQFIGSCLIGLSIGYTILNQYLDVFFRFIHNVSSDRTVQVFSA